MHGQHVGTVRVTDSIYSPVSPCTFFYHTTQHNTTHKFSYWIIIITYQSSFTTLFPTKRKRNMTTATFVDIILAILLPPLGVFLRFGCEVPNSFTFFISFHFIFFFFFIIFLSYSFFMWLIINSGWVLDLFVADPFWLSPWDTLCYLCYHQVNFNLCKRPFTSLSLPFASVLFLYFV